MVVVQAQRAATVMKVYAGHAIEEVAFLALAALRTGLSGRTGHPAEPFLASVLAEPNARAVSAASWAPQG